MRVPTDDHLSRPWVITRIAPDFDLLDVWALPVRGGPDDFVRFLDVMSSLDPTASPSPVSRFLFWVRLRAGAWLGWDDAQDRPVPGSSEPTLRVRLPSDLRASADDFAIGNVGRRVAGGFRPLYRTATEAAAEVSNATVHGVLHLSWVEQGGGPYQAHMAVYVKPRGKLGTMYLRLIGPFRHLVVYPALMQQIEAAWLATSGRPAPDHGPSDG